MSRLRVLLAGMVLTAAMLMPTVAMAQEYPPPPPDEPPPPVERVERDLAFTGSNVLIGAAIAGAFVVVGGSLVWVSRRRRSAVGA